LFVSAITARGVTNKRTKLNYFSISVAQHLFLETPRVLNKSIVGAANEIVRIKRNCSRHLVLSMLCGYKYFIPSGLNTNVLLRSVNHCSHGFVSANVYYQADRSRDGYERPFIRRLPRCQLLQDRAVLILADQEINLLDEAFHVEWFFEKIIGACCLRPMINSRTACDQDHGYIFTA
jgi:hypothetical protein